MTSSIREKNTGYPVMEAFYTLQGEGFHQGRAAYFIRLGGCDVGCVWCDVKASWDAAAHPVRQTADLVQLVQKEGFPPGTKAGNGIVVVTGGEPLLHNLAPLTAGLKQAGYQTHIETSGAHPLSGNWDWICLSPKKFKAPLPEIFSVTDELKVVIYHKSDFAWAAQFASAVKPGAKLYLQPEWSRREQIMPLIINYIKENPQWELSLQLHKYINVP